jgi:flagellar hook assembly protein FlgD
MHVFAFRPPMPNPARSAVTLPIEIPAAGEPVIAIYDLSGRRVRKIAPGTLAAGRHPLVWDARNDRGHPVASGLYLARLTWRDRSAVRRVVLLR